MNEKNELKEMNENLKEMKRMMQEHYRKEFDILLLIVVMILFVIVYLLKYN